MLESHAQTTLANQCRWTWKLNMSPGVLVFLWKAMWCILPTRTMLEYTGMQFQNNYCSQCNFRMDDQELILITCPDEQLVWQKILEYLKMDGVLHTMGDWRKISRGAVSGKAKPKSLGRWLLPKLASLFGKLKINAFFQNEQTPVNKFVQQAIWMTNEKMAVGCSPEIVPGNSFMGGMGNYECSKKNIVKCILFDESSPIRLVQAQFRQVSWSRARRSGLWFYNQKL